MGSSVEPGLPNTLSIPKLRNRLITASRTVTCPGRGSGLLFSTLGFSYSDILLSLLFIYLYQFCFLFCFDFVAYYKAGYSKYTQWLDGFSDPSSFAYINYAARRSQSDVHHTAPWWYQVPCAQSPVPH